MSSLTPRPSATHAHSAPMGQPLAGHATMPAASLLGKPPFLPKTQAQLVALGQQLTQPFTQTSQTFWENAVALHLVGLLPNAETYFLPGETLYSCAYPLPGHPAITLEVRLSEVGCRWLLENALGDNTINSSAASVVSQLTRLEHQILQTWCETLFADAHDYLPLPSPDDVKAVSGEGTTLDFLWLMAAQAAEPVAKKPPLLPLTADNEYGKLILRIPRSYLRFYLNQQAGGLTLGQSLSPHALQHALQAVDIRVGATRLRLEDITALEQGDVLLLEDSHWQHLQIALPEQQHTTFTANIRLKQRVLHARTLAIPPGLNDVTDPMTFEAAAMATTATPFWNKLHIDVNASFEPVRIPLHDLQQLSEGLIMEVGDLTENTIHLHVDGKTIASGELVIIGDKFGVRIQHVTAESETAPAEPPAIMDLTPIEERPVRHHHEDTDTMHHHGDDDHGDDRHEDDDDSEGMPMAMASDDDGLGNDDDDW